MPVVTSRKAASLPWLRRPRGWITPRLSIESWTSQPSAVNRGARLRNASRPGDSRKIAAALDEIDGQRRHQCRQVHNPAGLLLFPIHLFERLGPAREHLQQMPGPLGKMSRPAVHVRIQRWLKATDQLRGWAVTRTQRFPCAV